MFAERSLLRARGCEQVRRFGGEDGQVQEARSKKQSKMAHVCCDQIWTRAQSCPPIVPRSAILSEPKTGRASASENICIPVTSGWLLTFGDQQKSYLNTSFIKWL